MGHLRRHNDGCTGCSHGASAFDQDIGWCVGHFRRHKDVVRRQAIADMYSDTTPAAFDQDISATGAWPLIRARLQRRGVPTDLGGGVHDDDRDGRVTFGGACSVAAPTRTSATGGSTRSRDERPYDMFADPAPRITSSTTELGWCNAPWSSGWFVDSAFPNSLRGRRPTACRRLLPHPQMSADDRCEKGHVGS